MCCETCLKMLKVHQLGAGVGSAFATGCLRGGIPQIISEKHQLVLIFIAILRISRQNLRNVISIFLFS